MNEAASSNKCPNCGATMPENSPEGLCPKCLLVGAAAPTDAAQGGTRPAAPSIEAVAAAFPQLEVLALIGQGGMGCVFKARQPQLNRFVALKILPEALARDAAFAARFAKEAQALAALSHPHIVTIHDFGRANGFFFLLMEFVDGVNLRQALGGGRFTPEQALAIVPPICDALQYAHERGIVHRDIKPENLLLDKTGRVKIADFGIAKMLERGSVRRSNDESASAEPTEIARSDDAAAGHRPALHEKGSLAAGTPQYMAPEQRENSKRADHRADIYSLGVVLYELLTGELPGTKLQPPSARVQIDVRLDEIVLRALAQEPELRYATAQEFKTRVETVTGFKTGTVSRVPNSRPTPAPASDSSRGFARLSLALFLCATLGTVLLMTVSHRDGLVLIFGVGALAFAAVFGFLGWRQRLGKIVALLSVGIPVAALLAALVWIGIYQLLGKPAAIQRAQRQQQAEELGAIAAANQAEVELPDNRLRQSKPEQFVPREGMANQTSWSVHPKPSFLNSNGWAVMARMTIGGVARIQLPGETQRRCDITLLKGNDAGVTVRIDDLARKSTMTLSLRRDQPGEITLDGVGYRVLFPTTHVAGSEPDVSHFAHIIVTEAGDTNEPPTNSASEGRGEERPNTGQGTPHFEPVKEATLGTNQFLSPGDGKVHSTKAAARGSVSILLENGKWFAEFHEMHAIPLPKQMGIKQWDTKSAAELIQDYRDAGFALLPNDRFGRTPIEPGELPLTFLLPGSGILQVTDLNVGATNGVKLRYKLVRP